MQEFAKEIIRRLETHFGDGVEISYQEFLKRNDIRYAAVVIHRKEENIGKIVYLDFYLEAYRQGISMEEIIKSILKMERDCKILEDNDSKSLLQMFPQYDSIKGNVIIILCNLERNQEYLKGKTYMEFLDLAVVFCRVAIDDGEGIGNIAIPTDIFEKWKISKEQLFSDAYTYGIEVHPKCWKKQLVEVSQYIESILGEAEEDDFGQYMNPPDSRMYVLSNKNGINGAAVMLYPDVMKEVAEELGWEKILIFPSSIHELLLVNAERWEEKYFDELKAHVRYVNEHCVSEAEFLSNNIYRYSLEDDRIEIAESRAINNRKQTEQDTGNDPVLF